uniref:Uncharacterized protein n=1 Tax=Salix viminalis TaxID=40686 RepID=A0A6N2KA03_SALVM
MIDLTELLSVEGTLCFKLDMRIDGVHALMKLQVLVLQIFRVKCVKVEAFMSIQAISFLGKIGLLGEYTPLRKKGRPLSDKSCMHLGPCKGYPEFSGCSWVRPFLTTEEQPTLVQESLEDNVNCYLP